MIKYICANNDKWSGNNGQSLINKTLASTINTGEGSKRCDASNYVSDNLPNDFDLKEIKRKELRETIEKNTNNIEDGAYLNCYNRSVSKDVIGTIDTGISFRNHSYVVNRVCGLYDKDNKRKQAGSIYDTDGLSPTLDTCTGGNHEPIILIKNNTKKGYLEAEEGDGIDLSSRMEYHRGTVQKDKSQTLDTQCGNNRGVVVKTIGNYSPSGHNASRIVDSDGVAPTVMENHGTITAIVDKTPKVLGGIGEKKSNGGTQYYQQYRIYDNNVSVAITTQNNPYYREELRIRKLTPRECFALMGVKLEDYLHCREHQSDASLYHLAGDSIVTTCLMAIIGELFQVPNYRKIIRDLTEELRGGKQWVKNLENN